MTDEKLASIALYYLEKGYNTEHIWYGDDLYNATEEEKDRCCDLYRECVDEGVKNFSTKYGL